MCDVYGNAYLTTAAERAENCSEGFLGPREGPDYKYIPINLEGKPGNVAIFPMPLRRVKPSSGIIDLEEEPLSKRAWVLQERYLSPRTLHFASTQMYFECRSAFYTQDRHLQHKDTKRDFKIHRRETAKDDAKPKVAWNNIVRRYTERYLTVQSDKLPAIEGLAARVFLERGAHQSPSNDYLAGLWSSFRDYCGKPSLKMGNEALQQLKQDHPGLGLLLTCLLPLWAIEIPKVLLL